MMVVLNIIIGLFGLGIVVFFHELGHFLAARAVGINVEAFSIGWGKPILKKKIGKVEYRLGMFPVGGYCKMQGETDYKEAWEKMRSGEEKEKSSYLGASPAARILVSLGGPLFNLVFAVILLSFLWGAGFEIHTFENRIVLASDVDGQINPADTAGLRTGDYIIDINGKKISYYHEIQENIALNPNKTLPVTIDRDGRIMNLQITPYLDKSSGMGKIGVYYYARPVIASVTEDSAAQKAGLLPGDLIISVNDVPLQNTIDLMKVMKDKTSELFLAYERRESPIEVYRGMAQIDMEALHDGEIGFSWETITYRTPDLSFPAAIVKGIQESYKTLYVSVASLKLLFMGIDLTQAVSGPVRITYMMGDVATQGFGQSFGTGLRSIVNFIALISIALCVMNMLPLPILDGGMIILFLVEMIRRKPIPPKAVEIFQACGMAIIFGLMVLALFGDILFFIRK